MLGPLLSKTHFTSKAMTASSTGASLPYRLRLPGPTAVPDRVLQAAAQPMIAHRGPEFLARFKAIQDQLLLATYLVPYSQETTRCLGHSAGS